MSKNHQFDLTPYTVPPGKAVRLDDHDPGRTDGLEDKSSGKKVLKEDVSRLSDAQRRLWAGGSHAILVILQALDAAGKDGAIRHVMSGVNPQGVDVHSFKAPTEEERKHHFLWRPARVMPARGRIALFNRSYYEEVLVVRVHPEFLDSQYTPSRLKGKPLEERWQQRYRDINEFEQSAVNNDISVVKFFLNVSWEEQRERFLDRLNKPEKNWKFSSADLHERGFWKDYRHAYEAMLEATSTEAAPWHVIPADHKWYARALIADIIVRRIESLPLEIPNISPEEKKKLAAARKQLEAEKATPDG